VLLLLMINVNFCFSLSTIVSHVEYVNIESWITLDMKNILNMDKYWLGVYITPMLLFKVMCSIIQKVEIYWFILRVSEYIKII
jgi:hypothetical protein